MKRKTEKEILGLFEKKGKYKTMTIIFSVVSIMMLLIDIMLCIVNFPFVKFIFNSSILLSLSLNIIIYLVNKYLKSPKNKGEEVVVEYDFFGYSKIEPLKDIVVETGVTCEG